MKYQIFRHTLTQHVTKMVMWLSSVYFCLTTFVFIFYCNSCQARGAVCVAVQEKLRDLHPAVEADVWEWSDEDAAADLAHGGPGDRGIGWHVLPRPWECHQGHEGHWQRQVRQWAYTFYLLQLWERHQRCDRHWQRQVRQRDYTLYLLQLWERHQHHDGHWQRQVRQLAYKLCLLQF